MANDLSGQSWVIDTASTTAVKTGLVYIRSFVFSGYAADTDSCVIKFIDGAGNLKILVTLQGNANLDAVNYNLGSPIWVRNLTVTTLSAGQLTVNL